MTLTVRHPWALPVAALILAALMAGCQKEEPMALPPATFEEILTAAPPAPPDPNITKVDLNATILLDLPPLLVGQDCMEAGAYTVTYGNPYPLSPPWVWEAANERVGSPTVTSNVAGFGNRGGMFHPVVTCESYAAGSSTGTGVIFGYGAIQVKPPTFEKDGAAIGYEAGPSTLDYVSTHVWAADANVLGALADIGIAAVSGQGTLEIPGPDVVHVVNQDSSVGTFEAYGAVQQLGPKDAEIIRVWTFAPAPGGFRPIPLDFIDTAGSHKVTQQASAACTFPGVGPSANQAGHNCVILQYSGFGREVRVGPIPNIVLAALPLAG